MIDEHHSSSLADAAVAAIEAIGGGAATAKVCGVTRFAVQQWKSSRIPAEQVGKVSAAAKMPLHQLRPDLFQPAAA